MGWRLQLLLKDFNTTHDISLMIFFKYCLVYKSYISLTLIQLPVLIFVNAFSQATAHIAP